MRVLEINFRSSTSSSPLSPCLHRIHHRQHTKNCVYGFSSLTSIMCLMWAREREKFYTAKPSDDVEWKYENFPLSEIPQKRLKKKGKRKVSHFLWHSPRLACQSHFLYHIEFLQRWAHRTHTRRESHSIEILWNCLKTCSWKIRREAREKEDPSKKSESLTFHFWDCIMKITSEMSLNL